MEIEEIKKLELADIKKMNNKDRWGLVSEMKDAIFRARMDIHTGRSTKNQDVKILKRKLASTLTVISQ